LLKRPPNQEFERHMLPHLDAAYNFARWLMRNTEDAEDAVQDAFLRPTSHSPATKAAVRKPG